MSRLIDAEVLIEQLREADRKCSNDIIKACIGLVQTQYTAYDVDAVVAELEKERMRYFLTIANGNDENMNLAYCKISNAIDTAIDIVKRGGVE